MRYGSNVLSVANTKKNSRQRQSNWDREQQQVNQIPDLPPMNTEDHDIPPPLVPVGLDVELDDDYISAT